jgi:fructosamine-3-kinase
MTSLEVIRDEIARVTGSRPTGDPEPVGGGCIHNAFVLGDYFLKTNRPSFLEMFEAEADGLRAIRATGTIRAPEPVIAGAGESAAFLAMERMDLGGRGDEGALGEQIAALHRCTDAAHGWERDNFIGSTPQPNQPCGDWAEFFRDRRLGHMLDLLSDRGIDFSGSKRFLERVPDLLGGGAAAPPSLLHGDLWGGNAGFLSDGTPVVFDPAVYRGHREADLAMTTLFGGFGPRFYDAYNAAWPPEPGHEERRGLYNLYHILNHALLFGGGYASQAAGIIRRYARA